MKKMSLFFIAFMFLAVFAHSQVILGGSASLLSNDGNSQIGGGVQLKFMFGDRLAIGGTIRAYPKNFEEEIVNIGGSTGTLRSANAVVPVAGMIEYYLGKNNNFQPYLGTDVGLYFNKNFTEFDSGNTTIVNQENSKTYFGIAPKGGMQIKLGGLFAIFGQAQYHFLFGSGDPDKITVPGFGGASIETKPSDKFWTFDVGILMRLRAAGK
ncbi:MAG: hypothetical protein ACXWV4_12145 [Flavitalea sp.]